MPYSPKLKPDLVKKLYQLKHSSPDKPPMTTMVNEAVEDYLNKKGATHSSSNNFNLPTTN